MSKAMIALLFLVTLAPTSATASEIFPGLRKKKQQMAAMQTATHAKVALKPELAQESAVVAPVPAVVPSVVDANADGMPELPAVSQMLSGASGTLKSVSSQASGLQARVVQAQMQRNEDGKAKGCV